jgi:diguanylate cyclase
VSRLREQRLWLGWTILGLLGILAYFFLLPTEGWAHTILYDALGLASSLAIIVGVRAHRPANAPVWYLFAIGKMIFTGGDITYSIYVYGFGTSPFPSVGDLFYLVSYPFLFGGLVALIRGRSAGRDRAGILDSCIVGVALGLLCWVFVMDPIVDHHGPLLGMVVSLSYPIADVCMVVLLARLATTPGSRTASYRMLFAAIVLLLGSDIGLALLTTLSSYTNGPVDIGWLLSYVLWAAAALHPSVRVLPEAVTTRDTAFQRSRVVPMVGIVLLAPAVLIGQGVYDPADIDWLPIGIATGVLCLLLLARAGGMVTMIRQQSSRLTDLAMHDALTGLPNRRLFEQHIDRALGGGCGVQVALVDLDDFKIVNDRLGHIVGDGLLVEVGHRMRRAVRDTDLVARLGGDEFALVFPDATPDEADTIAARIIGRLQQPVIVGEHQLFVRASVGLADGTGTDDALEVVRRADIAMYAAKENGGQRFRRYEHELDRRATEHAQVGAELRHALDEDQFHLVYQPIVTLPDGRLAGVEALVRWRHPDLGTVMPDRFVPIAERSGLIVELGRWVMSQACRQLIEWDARFGAAAPPKMSVNVSARQLTEPDFAQVVAGVLVEHELPPHRLMIEVTETAVFGGGRAVDQLRSLHTLGVQVALDDFGTGHSSLGLLMSCPVDVLKVDKSFVDSLTLATKHSVIATALVAVAEGLNLEAIAEGVETSEQAGLLFELGYRYAQGYHFGRPVEGETFAESLAAPADQRALPASP